MKTCKYCSPDKTIWTSYETGDPCAINIMAAAADDREGGTLFVDVYYRDAELVCYKLPAVACPFCGRWLRKED